MRNDRWHETDCACTAIQLTDNLQRQRKRRSAEIEVNECSERARSDANEERGDECIGGERELESERKKKTECGEGEEEVGKLHSHQMAIIFLHICATPTMTPGHEMRGAARTLFIRCG